jgi:hypothetical protein
LTSEAIENLTTDPRLAYDIAKAAITSLTDNFHTMQRPGYDDMGDLGTIDSSLRTIAEKVKTILSEEEREEFASWIEGWDNIGEPYGLTMDTQLLETVEFIRGNDGDQKSEEKLDERKPAAMPTKADGGQKPEEEVYERKPAAMPTKPDGGQDKSDSNNLINENVKNNELVH